MTACSVCGFGLPARNAGLCASCTTRSERWMRAGVERFLAHPRVRRQLVLCLSAIPAPIDPARWADQILADLARGYDQLDGIGPECETPEAETSLEQPTPGEYDDMAVWLSQAGLMR